MKKTLVVILLVMAFCCSAWAEEVHRKLNGVWVSDVLTVKIDFDKGTYESIFMGEEKVRKLAFVKELGNSVVFTIDESKVTAQIQENGNVLLTKEGGIPVLMKRVKKDIDTNPAFRQR